MAKTSARGSFTSIAAVGLIAVGIYLGSIMKSPGPGGDDSEVSVSAPSASETVLPADPGPEPELPEQPDEPALEPMGPPAMIAIVIHADSFDVERPDVAGSQTLPLEELSTLAASTTGTDEGIRVRVQRHISATAGAQQQLFDALTAAGIKKESMQVMSEFVE